MNFYRTSIEILLYFRKSTISCIKDSKKSYCTLRELPLYFLRNTYKVQYKFRYNKKGGDT